MKHLLIAAVLLAALPVFAQTTSTSGSTATATGAAVNAGVNTNIGFNSTTPAHTSADIRYSGLEKPSANVNLTAIAPPPSPKTCADTGVSLGGGGRSGGAIIAFGTGAEEGCDVGRDIEIVVYLLKLPEGSVEYKVTIQRACQKASIKKAFVDAGEGERCEKAKTVAAAPVTSNRLALLP